MSFKRIGKSFALALALYCAGTANAQPVAEEDAEAKAARLIGEAVAENRFILEYDGSRFSGPGWEKLIEEGRAAQFFMIGEEHGIAENPKLAAALFRELSAFGYSRVVIETSPHMARRLDRASRQGLDGLRQLFAEPGGEPAFFGMLEEAEFLVEARASVDDDQPVFWGIDYEVLSDRQLLTRLGEMDMPPAARSAFERLNQAAQASWKKFGQERDPRNIFSFAGDPQLVSDVKDSWPGRSAEADRILHTMGETLSINRLFFGGENWLSNQRRGNLIRQNFLSYWNRAKELGDPPKVMAKLGASHLVRGRSYTEAYDLGALLPEIAALHGTRSFSVLVIPGQGDQTAVFNPVAMSFNPAPAKDGYERGMGPIMAGVSPESFTLVDLRPLRPLLRKGALRSDYRLLRAIMGFDMMLVMSGSTPSAELDHE